MEASHSKGIWMRLRNFGSSDVEQIFEPKLYDRDGNEIEIPKCEACNRELNPIMGASSICWICIEHGLKADRLKAAGIK